MNTKRLSLNFIILMGLVSLFGDITYESARSIIGPYLFLLGAGAGVVGLVSGLGEFLGYALRLPFGFIADKNKAYWKFTLLGYSLVFTIPLLGISKHWQWVVVLILLERIGKAIRAPSRDALISYATKSTGRGFGFGLHEALDQIGAVFGPLVFSFVFWLKGSYRLGFSLLWIPAIFMFIFLEMARQKFKLPQELERIKEPTSAKLSRSFWLYTFFIFFAVLGLVNFQLISYHFKTKGVFSDFGIPTLYALAMLTDALIAIIIGRLYDRMGMGVMLSIPLLTIFVPLLSFSQSYSLILIGIIVWGIILGAHETIMRAGVADLASASARASAYGIFNTAYGIGCFLGSTIMGFLYEISIFYLVFFSIVASLVSVFFYFLLVKSPLR